MSNDKIKSLSTREQCRLKLPIWYGSNSNYTHGLKEVVANSADEIINNYEDGVIYIKLEEDMETLEVIDTGRGIPINGETDGIPNYEVLFSTLFTGTKYDNTESNQATTGTNGVGTCVLNHTSDLFEVEVSKGGRRYRVTFTNGGYTDGLEDLGERSEYEHYSKVTFKLSNEVYTNTKFTLEEVLEIAEKISACSNKLTVMVAHKEFAKTFHYNSLENYFDEKATNIITLKMVGANKVFEEEDNGSTDRINMELVLGATNKEVVHQSFLNLTYLPEQGTIDEGVVSGIRNHVNKYLKNKNLYAKNEKQISTQDVESAISYAVSATSTNVSFANQTKFATHKKLYKDVAQKYVTELLEIYEIENPVDMEKLSKQILIAMRVRVKSTKMLENLTKKLSEEMTLINKPQGLLGCRSEDIAENRLFIAEGLSALSGLSMARNSDIDALFAIRGKMLNCLKADLDTIFKNDIVMNILRILGCGVEVSSKKNKEFNTFDLTKLKYGKIILAVDADPDGKNIRALLLSMFYRLTPTLIKEGRIYFVNAPLFEIECESEGKTYFAINEQEKEEILSKLKGKKVFINRNKGLGEQSAEASADTIMDTEYRGLHQVTMEDVEVAMEDFELFMGTVVAPRKEFIGNNFDKEDVEAYEGSVDVRTLLEDDCMEYNKYVITDRALPRIDGLKPSHRRILYTMYKRGLNFNKQRSKSAHVTGATMALHPHGSTYGTTARLARKDTMNVPLVDGKGAFGLHASTMIQEASERYTEVRLAEVTQELFKNIDKGIVPMEHNFDRTLLEPYVLPTTFPLILANVTIGVAVGFSSNICSYNLRELCGNTAKMLKGEPLDVLVPDFATGSTIVSDVEVFKKIHETGLGTIKQRAKYEVKGNRIIINELPYMSTIESIVEKIIDLVKEGTIKEVVDVNNYSDKNGINITIDMKKNTNAEILIAKLFKLTALENTFSCNFTLIIDNRPVVLGAEQILRHWCNFRLDIAKNTIEYDIKQSQKELDLLVGQRTILPYIDDCTALIQKSVSDKETIIALMSKYNLTETQADYIINLKLKYLNKEHINKQLQKIEKLEQDIEMFKHILSDENTMKQMIANQLVQIGEKYGSDRKTEIIDNSPVIDTLSTFIEDYNIQIMVTKEGYLKKMKLTSLRGNVNHKLKDGDKIVAEYNSSNKADLLVFTNKQNCYKVKAHTLEDHKASVLGVYLPSMLEMEKEETILSVIPTVDYKENLLIAYQNGKVAKISLSSYETKTMRKKLVNALSDNNVCGIYLLTIDKDFVISTSERILAFNSTNVPLKSTKNTQGVSVLNTKGLQVEKFKSVEEVSLKDIEFYRGGKVGKTLQEGDAI